MLIVLLGMWHEALVISEALLVSSICGVWNAWLCCFFALFTLSLVGDVLN